MYVSILKPNMKDALDNVRDDALAEAVEKISSWCSKWWVIRTESVDTQEMYVTSIWNEDSFKQLFRISEIKDDGTYVIKYVGLSPRIIIDMYESEEREPKFELAEDPRVEIIPHKIISTDNTGKVTIRLFSGGPIPVTSSPIVCDDGYTSIAEIGNDVVYDNIPKNFWND